MTPPIFLESLGSVDKRTTKDFWKQKLRPWDMALQSWSLGGYGEYQVHHWQWHGVMSTRWAIKSLWATKSSGDSTYIFRKLRSRRQTYNQRCFKTKVLNLIYDVAKSVTWPVWGAPSLPWAMLAPHQLARAISHDRNFCFQKSLVVCLSTDPKDSKNIGEIFVRIF